MLTKLMFEIHNQHFENILGEGVWTFNPLVYVPP